MSTTLDLARSRLNYVECPPTAAGVCRYAGHRGRASNHTEFGEAYGWNGVAWCAIFLSWCFAGVGLGHLYRFASTAASIAWAKKTGRWHPSSVRPSPGWVAVKLYTSTTGHTGIVEGVEADGSVYTIEGNTSNGDDRNGGIVMRRRRARSFWLGWIELPLQAAGVTPPQPVHVPPPIPGEPAMFEFFAYAPAFNGGVEVAMGDLDGDGNLEIVTVPGPGGGAHVRVWRLDTTRRSVVELGGFFAFPSDMALGLTVSLSEAKKDADGKVVERGMITVAARAGGGPHVKGFEWPTVIEK